MSQKIKGSIEEYKTHPQHEILKLNRNETNCICRVCYSMFLNNKASIKQHFSTWKHIDNKFK
jgi:hypothetical protein